MNLIQVIGGVLVIDGLGNLLISGRDPSRDPSRIVESVIGGFLYAVGKED